MTLNQFVKSPVLVHHFNEHCALDQSLTFLDFVRNHYNKLQHPDDEHNDHDNLPFKAVQNLGNNLIFINTTCLQISNIVYSPEHKNVTTRNIRFLNDDRESGLWRPPIFA